MSLPKMFEDQQTRHAMSNHRMTFQITDTRQKETLGNTQYDFGTLIYRERAKLIDSTDHHTSMNY
jgi:hypothetical protein